MSDAVTALEGAVNFRGVGGLPVAGGGRTADGVLYRSDALHALTDRGVATLTHSPIDVVVDFRTATERDMARDRLPTARRVHETHLPLLEGAMSHIVEEALAARALGDHTRFGRAAQQAMANLPTLGQMYTGMLAGGAASFARVATLVAGTGRREAGAVLVHCTAGKDRTGVCTALMLDAAGVERDAIVHDYTLSQHNLGGAWLDKMVHMVEGFGVPVTPELRTLIGGSPAEAIEQALAWLDEQGGSAAYLRSGGLGEADLDALRARLAG